MTNDKTKNTNSYGQIISSSSIIGGAAGINYLIAMIRIKLVAVMLGPSGVGLVGLYVSITGLMGTISGLGIDSSAVREIANSQSSGEAERIAQSVLTLRRVCWVSGIMGWLLTAAFSYPLSVLAFGTPERALTIAFLGGTILLGALTVGHTATIQGMRRIGDLAKLSVFGPIFGTISAVGAYALLGEKGIVPVLFITAVINFGVAAWYSKKISYVSVRQSWATTRKESKRLVGLGLAFMYGALLAALVGLVIRLFIIRKLGVDANGIYQAAWALSGLFAGFIIGAMGADFYPRLTAVASDNEKVNRLVNEQVEIGVLLALPGLIGTLAFAPWLMHLFYSEEFLAGASLLPWLAVGVFFQVISFPLGFIQRAKGSTAWIFASQSHLNFLNTLLALVLLNRFGLESVAWAFAITSGVHGAVVYLIATRLSSFRWSRSVVGLILPALGMIALGIFLQMAVPASLKIFLNIALLLCGTLFSIRGLVIRLGDGHIVSRTALKIPGARKLCGL